MKNKRFNLLSVIGVLIGLACVLLLGAVFYGAMAYQLLGEQQETTAQQSLAVTQLVLPDMQLLSEHTDQQEMGGEICMVTTRLYQAQDGMQIEAVSASPAAYIERLSQENWMPQLITGYVLAGMEAVYSVREGAGMLSARAGDHIFMLRADADEQTIYALGAQAAMQ